MNTNPTPSHIRLYLSTERKELYSVNWITFIVNYMHEWDIGAVCSKMVQLRQLTNSVLAEIAIHAWRGHGGHKLDLWIHSFVLLIHFIFQY